jgi:macrolide transport system ATP-binding/permease protein
MKRLRSFFQRLFGFLRSSEQDINSKIGGNLRLHVDDNMRAGMTGHEARGDAIGGLLENFVQDTRFALRQLRKSPGFAATAIIMLAAGICASVAIFAFVDAALLKPLPYQSPAHLVGVYERGSCGERCPLSYQDYLDWKRLNTVFTSLDIYSRSGATIPTASGPRITPIAGVSAGFFNTLGVTPFLGRGFSAGEDAAGAPRIALLSYGAWQKNYGSRTDIVGQNVVLDDIATTIVGVLPRGFNFAPAESAEFWIPLQPTGECAKRRRCHNLFGVARLKDEASVGTALSNTKTVARQLEQQYPDSNQGRAANVLPLSEVISGNIRPLLLILLSGAGLLLLIACLNVSSLVLVRTEGRKREVAVRSSLGASPKRLSRQFATEGLLLVVVGGGAGLAASYWAMQILTKLIPEHMLASMPYLLGLTLNPRVLVFAAVISLLAAILFSFTPRLSLAKTAVRGNLAEGSRSVAGTSWRRLGSKLVIVELATAMVLLVGAGLLGQSLYHLLHVELAFYPDHLATLNVNAPGKRYDTAAKSMDWARRTLSRIAILPGVKSVGTSSVMVVSSNNVSQWIRFLGKPYNGEHNDVSFRSVSDKYFETLQAKLVRGRFFADSDDLTKPKVVIINRALAEHYFPGEDPLGRQIGDTELSPKSLMEIVGIVDNIREEALDDEIQPAIYVPFNQEPDSGFDLVVRTAQSPQAILPSLSQAIHEIDPDVATVRPITMEDRIHDSPAAYMHRSAAWLVGGFATLALALGVIGLYGVIAYSVSQRTREVGVRMALGAQRSTVYRMVLQEAGILSGIGIVVGLFCSLVFASLLQKLLFETPPRDIPTLAAVAAVLCAASLLASYVPARQAASVNPVEAMRAE